MLDALATESLAPLWQAVHHRLATGHAVTRVRLGPLDHDQRAALADLLGTARLPGENPTIALARLDDLLVASVGLTAREVVTQLIGPSPDRAAERSEADAARAALWDWLARHEVVVAQPVLTDWVGTVRRKGLTGGSVEHTRAELERALRVLSRLPAAGVPLPVLADEVLGDAHALDEGTRCAALVLRALAAIYATTFPADAQARRELWERAGVAEDEISPVVLVAGLTLDGDDVVSRVLAACADAGQVAALTLSQVRSASFAGAPADVWVFENPSVLAVATRRAGAVCPPIVCTSGWPNSAVVLLLRGLAAAGSALHYHGDFDGEGIRIAAHVMARTGATPWRMTSADYLSALPGKGNPVGRVTAAPWDDGLAAAMREHGVAVAEERVAAGLLAVLVGD